MRLVTMRRHPDLALTLAVLLLTSAAPALAYQTKLDSTGAPVRWNRALTFVVQTDADSALGEPGAFEALEAAVRTVEEAAPGLQLRLAPGETDGVGYDLREGARNQSEIVVPREWAYDAHLIAVTVVTLNTRTHEIIDADIAFNVAHRRFKVLHKSSKGGGDFDDIQNTLTHELGHAVGLAHNPEAPEAVMYPGARKGEINKRALSQDDRDGLAAVYPANIAPVAADGAQAHPGAGCSSTAGGGAPWALLLLIPALFAMKRRVRHQRALVMGLALVAPATSFADEDSLKHAAWVVTGEIVAARTLPPSPDARLLWTELEVRVRECVSGACPSTTRLRVPGGRFGDLEQVVEHHPVPEQGEVVALVMPAQTSVASAPARPVVFRLTRPPEFVRFAELLGRAGLTAHFAHRVSAHTSRSPATRRHGP